MRSPRPSVPVLVGIALLVAVAVARTTAIRERAAFGLGEGMPSREAALARGFVLGDDSGVDGATKEDFIRSGLSHLLAVSGENVTLLALLAMPVLAAFGVPLRERLIWVIALIAVYVPLAGSGPSIQRAGVMGAVGLLATLRGRRASRLYALGLAAVATLAIDPSVASNVGWQLSFAAVLGILLLASPIRDRVLDCLDRLAAGLAGPGPGGDHFGSGLGPVASGGHRVASGQDPVRSSRGNSARVRGAAPARGGRWRRALADGIAVTIAATLATGPLIAFVFEEVSVMSLAANVLAQPAVAPAMWLGMISAALAQVPGIPLRAINGLAGLLLAYIAQVAAWCGRPSWAVLHVHLGLVGMLATYAAMAAAITAIPPLARARRLAAARSGAPPSPTAVGPSRASPLGIDPSPASPFAVDPASAQRYAVDLGPARRNAVDLGPARRSAVDLGPVWRAKGRPHPEARAKDRPRFGVRRSAVLGGFLVALGVVAALIAVRHRGPGTLPASTPGLRIEVLDVGQGDAILLQPRDAPAVLVDGGPPGDELVAKLRAEGAERLGAAIVTHDQSDHAAGIAEALGEVPISRLVYGRLDRRFLAAARAAGVPPEEVAAGTTLRSGSLRLEVVWPPPELLAEDPPDTDPNLLALVIRARWHRFTMLLTADAEAETTPLDPGSIDVLKVAHHGSDDAGLGPLLDRIRPRLAVISVGADNSYGHPTPGTLATLAAHGVPTLRTDEDGTVEIDVTRRGFSVDPPP